MISRRTLLIAGVAASMKTTGALAPELHKETQMDIDIKRNGAH
jgi:hypothetical protein